MKKTLFLIIFMIGVFFCFDKTNAGTYQLFTNPASMTEYTSYLWNVNWHYEEQTIQEFSPEISGFITSFTVRDLGDFQNFLYLSNGITTTYGNCTWETVDYDKCFLNEPLFVLQGQKIELRKKNHLTGTKTIYGQSPSTTYTNSYGYDRALRMQSGPDDLNIDHWIKYTINPNTQYFYFIEPNTTPNIEYNMLYNVVFQCYNSNSKYAIYQNDNYLLATSTDFHYCNDSQYGGSETGLVRWVFTGLDGWNTLTILDENYLSNPSEVYKIDRKYFGKMPGYGINDLFATVLYPDIDEDTGLFYTVTTTDATPSGIINGFLIGIKSNNYTVDPTNAEAIYQVYLVTSTYQWLTPEQEYGVPDENGWTLTDAILGSSLVENTKYGTWDFITNIETWEGIYSHYRITRIASDEGYNGEVDLEYFTAVPWSAGFDGNGSSFFPNAYTTTTIPLVGEHDPDGIPYGISWCENTCGINTEDIKKIQNQSFWTSLTSLYLIPKTTCAGICNLIYPKKFISGQITDFAEFLDTLQTYPPFGYFYTYRDGFTQITSSSMSSSTNWDAIGNWTFFVWIRTLLGYIIYIAFGLFIYKTFTKFL